MNILSSLQQFTRWCTRLFPKDKHISFAGSAGDSRSIRSNIKHIRLNWRVIRTALYLRYGNIRTTPWSPRNRAIVANYKRELHQAAVIGTTAWAKAFSSRSRDAAILGIGIRTSGAKKRSYLFIASTLSRAMHNPPPSQSDVLEEVNNCITRITTRTPLPDEDIMSALESFIETKLRGSVNDNQRLPVPGTSSCYENPASKGGCYAEIDRVYGQPDMAAYQEVFYSEFQTQFEYVQGHPNALNSYRVEDEYIARAYELAERPSQDTMFTQVLDRLPKKKQCKILPIVEPTGKVRIATIHTAPMMWAAKAINSLLLPHLKRFSVTRSALRNVQEYQVTYPSREAFIYSADLSKSTDPMSVDLVGRIFQAIQRAITGLPSWFATAVKHVLDHQTLLHEGREIRLECGALMGMGPGWTALCLLNAFCAYRAGAPLESFKVCGDDLIALWPAEIANRYEQNLHIFGLVPNVSKSFRSSEAGVFCERLVGRVSDHKAIVYPFVRLGEASGFRALGGDKGRLMHDRLCSQYVIPPLRQLVRETLKQHSLGPKVRGRYSEAGGGSLPPDAISLIAYLERGSTKLTTVEQILDEKDIMKEIRAIPPAESGVRRSELVAFARKNLQDRLRRRYNQPLQKPDLKSRAATIKSLNVRRNNAKLLLKKHGSVKRAARALIDSGESIIHEDHPYANKLLKQITRHARNKRFRRAILAIKSVEANTMIDMEAADSVLRDTLHDWEHPVTIHLTPARRVWDSTPL